MPASGDSGEGKGFLSSVYSAFEDVYFSFMDGLQGLGLNVYGWFVDPLENSGIPSFIVSLLLLLVLLGGGIYILNPNILSPSSNLQVSVLSEGKPIDGATVELRVEGAQSVTSVTDAEGIASFAKVPGGKKAIVKVTKAGFEDLAKSIVTGDVKDFFAELAAQSTPATPPAPKVRVVFQDVDTKKPISSVKVVYQGPVSGLKEIYTEDDGSALLEFSDASVRLWATNPYYQALVDTVRSGEQKTIFMKALNNNPINDQNNSGNNGQCSGANCPQPLDSVSVSVLDQDGNLVDARVELYVSGSLLAAKSAFAANGVAAFPNVAAIGTSVYAKAYPSNTDKYTEGESDPQKVAKGGTDLVVRVSQKAALDPSATKLLQATVQDEAGNVVTDANVFLILQSTTDPSAYKVSDEAGKVVFEVVGDKSFTLIAWKDGFLPSDTYVVPQSKTSQTIVLKKLVLGSFGMVNVSIVDEDGNGVVGAQVTLRYSKDNLPLGIPSLNTGEMYNAIFSGVPIQTIKAVATYGAFKGESAGFKVAAGVENRIVVQLARPTGRIAVIAADPFTGQPIVNARITAVDRNNRKTVNCLTNSVGACVLQDVPAAISITLFVGATSYLNYSIGGLVVPAGETISVNVSDGLVPKFLANQTRLKLSVFDASCAGNAIRPGSTIQKGRTYCVRLDFNIPNASDPTGFFLRVGGRGTADGDNAAITSYSDYGDLGLTLDTMALVKAPRFGGESCDEQAAETGTQSKWINYEFNGVQGSKTVLLRVFVKPTALDNSKLDLNYFSYAVKGGKYFRVPFDDSLGTQRSVDGTDYCEAASNLTSFKVTSGSVQYGDKGGISMGFAAAAASGISPSLQATAGSTFLIKFTAEYFNAPGAPVLRISSLDPQGSVRGFVKFNSYTLSSGGVIVPTSPLGGSSSETIQFNPSSVQDVGGVFQLNGTINATAVLPVSLSKVRLEFLDGSIALANVTASATITGNARPDILLVPCCVQLNANQDNSLVAIVTTSGSAVADTPVSVIGLSDYANPFGPQYADGDIQVIGDGSEGKGRIGKYAFLLHPIRAGRFALTVGGSSDARFEQTVKYVDVGQNNFIQAFPTSLSLGCGSDRLALTNQLSFSGATANLSFTDSAPCLEIAAATGVQCISSQQGTCVKWQVALGAGETKTLRINPKRSGACVLAISSSLGPLVCAYSTIESVVACSNLDPQCTIAATPSTVFGGAGTAGANVSTLSASITNLPLAAGLAAEFDCGEGAKKSTAVQSQPNGAGTASISCQYSEVSDVQTRNASLRVLDALGQAVSPEIYCSTQVLVAPKPGGPAACIISSQPLQGSFKAKIRATFFNLKPTDSKAVFVCNEQDPAADFGEATLAYNPSTKAFTAEFECDYEGKQGILFNASAAAGSAYCFNQSTRIVPASSGCKLGSGTSAETLAFGACSHSAPPLICGGTATTPALEFDRTGVCCIEALGATAVLDTTSGPTPFCKTTTTNPQPDSCNDGVTLKGTCRKLTVDGTLRATPFFCDANKNWVGNASCCEAVPGFAFSSQTGQCQPVDINACRLTAGSITQTIGFGNCTVAPAGLRCGGSSTSPQLTGDSACCAAQLGSGYAWSAGNNSCIRGNGNGLGDCDAFTFVGQCQQPDPANPYWTPSPQKCFNVGSGPQWFFGRSECCAAYNNKEYVLSDDAKACLEVPAWMLEPACEFTERSLTLSADGKSYTAQFNITGRRLANFYNGNIEFDYSCDDGLQEYESQNASILTSSIRTTGFGCTFQRGFFNSSVKPKARIIVTSQVTGNQKMADCSLTGPQVNPSHQIIIPGSSGQQPTFKVGIALGALNFTTITPPPLGPLSGLRMFVDTVSLPAGITKDNLVLYLECDSGTQKASMSYDELVQNEWYAQCAYSTSFTNRNGPQMHQPRAYYQLTVGDQTYPLAGIPPSFAQVAEYPQPIAAGITSTTLKQPSLRDQNLSLELKADYRKLPMGLGQQTIVVGCGNGETGVPVAVTVNNGSAFAKLVCNYTTSALSTSDYYYYSAVSVLTEADAHAELAIDYAAPVPSVFCEWTGLPNEIVVGGDGLDRFTPRANITGLSTMPSAVEFDCGNGKKVAATTIVQTGTYGKEITVTATATSQCVYDFTFMAGESSKVIQLNIASDSEQCGPKTLTANSVALGTTRALLSRPEFVDADLLGGEARVNITVINPPIAFEALDPTAAFDCGTGTNGKLKVPMEKHEETDYIPANGSGFNITSPTVFYAETTCTYNAVLKNTTRTIRGSVIAKQPYGNIVTVPPQVSFNQLGAPTNTTPINNTDNTTLPNLTAAGFTPSEELRECNGMGLLAALMPLLAQPAGNFGGSGGGSGGGGNINPGIFPPPEYDEAADRALLQAAAVSAIKKYSGKLFVIYQDVDKKLKINPPTMDYTIEFVKPLTAANAPPVVVLFAGSVGLNKDQITDQSSITVEVTPENVECLQVGVVGNEEKANQVKIALGKSAGFKIYTTDAPECKHGTFTFRLGVVGQPASQSAVNVKLVELTGLGLDELYGAVFAPKTGTQIAYRRNDDWLANPSPIPGVPSVTPQPFNVDPVIIAWNNQKKGASINPEKPYTLEGNPMGGLVQTSALSQPPVLGDKQMGGADRPLGTFGARTPAILRVVTPPDEKPSETETTGPNTWKWSTQANIQLADWKSDGLKPLGYFDIVGNKGIDDGGTGTLQMCRGNDFCTPAQVAALNTMLTKKLNEAATAYSKNIRQKVDAEVFQQALGEEMLKEIEKAKAKIKQKIEDYNKAVKDYQTRMQQQQSVINPGGGGIRPGGIPGGIPGQTPVGGGIPGFTPGLGNGITPYSGINGGGINPYGSGISPYGGGISPYGSGISPYGSGISPYGSGISPYGNGIPNGLGGTPNGQLGMPLGAGQGPFSGSSFVGPNGTKIIDGCIGVAACAMMMSSMMGMGGQGGGQQQSDSPFDPSQFMKMMAIPYCQSEKVQRSMSQGSGAFGSQFGGSPMGSMMMQRMQPVPQQGGGIPTGGGGGIPTGGQSLLTPTNLDKLIKAKVPDTGDLPLLETWGKQQYIDVVLSQVPETRIIVPYRGDINNVLQQPKATTSSGLQAFLYRIDFGLQKQSGSFIKESRILWNTLDDGSEEAKRLAAMSNLKNVVGYPYLYAKPGEAAKPVDATNAVPSIVKFDQGKPSLWTANKYQTAIDLMTTDNVQTKCNYAWNDDGITLKLETETKACRELKINSNPLELTTKTECQGRRACFYVLVAPDGEVYSGMVKAKILDQQIDEPAAQKGKWACLDSSTLNTKTQPTLDALRLDLYKFFGNEAFKPTKLLNFEKEIKDATSSIALGYGSDVLDEDTLPPAPRTEQCATGGTKFTNTKSPDTNKCFTTLKIDPSKREDGEAQYVVVACEPGIMLKPPVVSTIAG